MSIRFLDHLCHLTQGYQCILFIGKSRTGHGTPNVVSQLPKRGKDHLSRLAGTTFGNAISLLCHKCLMVHLLSIRTPRLPLWIHLLAVACTVARAYFIFYLRRNTLYLFLLNFMVFLSPLFFCLPGCCLALQHIYPFPQLSISHKLSGSALYPVFPTINKDFKQTDA